MDKKDLDILNKGEIKGRKDPEKSFSVTDIKEKKIPPSSTHHQDEASKRSEIDLSHATAGSNGANKFISERKEEKQRSDKDDSHISIISPTDAILETERQPQKIAVHEKKIKRDTPERKRHPSSEPKTRKPPKGGVRQRKSPKKKALSEKTTPPPVGLAPRPVSMSKGGIFARKRDQAHRRG